MQYDESIWQNQRELTTEEKERFYRLQSNENKRRISVCGCRTFEAREDKPSEVVREVVKAHDDFIAKFLGFVLAVVVVVGAFAVLRFASKFAH
jgi:hypothetical protein